MFSIQYQKTNTKPDKIYSILPTVLSLLEPIKGKIVVDVGCGTGFFTKEIARMGAECVYGIDISEDNLLIAEKNKLHNVQYLRLDVFRDSLPLCDLICFPFVLNLANNISEVMCALERCFSALNYGGKIVFVVDLPIENKSIDIIKRQQNFGAVKTLLGPQKDGTPLQVELYNNQRKIYSFQSRFLTPNCINNCLSNVGFRNILWHNPIISEEGFERMSALFWKDYQDICELGYITAEKVTR